MTLYRFDLTFTADGADHTDRYDFEAASVADAERFTDQLLYTPPTRFYDRTGRLYDANDVLIAEYREKAGQ